MKAYYLVKGNFRTFLGYEITEDAIFEAAMRIPSDVEGEVEIKEEQEMDPKIAEAIDRAMNGEDE